MCPDGVLAVTGVDEELASREVFMDDDGIRRLFDKDMSKGTEVFRDELLRRCLDVLGAEDAQHELEDDQLDHHAAADDLRTPASSHPTGVGE